MRKVARRVLTALVSLEVCVTAGACVDPFLAPEPTDEPVALFDIVWTEVDRHYAHFGTKGVDWDAVRDVYRPRVGPSTRSDELFRVFSEMLAELQDQHASLWSPGETWTYSRASGRRTEDFDREIAFGYLQEPVRWSASGRIAYGRLSNDVGYVHIPGFDPGAWGGEIDGALRALEGVRALVLDLRGNGGGTDLVAEVIQSRFVDRERVYRYYRYRNGPAHDDFTSLIADRIAPAGVRFRSPVAVLTDRGTFSAAEDFVLGLRGVDGVVTVGDTTGGGTGNPTHRELPNGWTFSVSRWQIFDADRKLLEDGVGLAPDVAVSVSREDVEEGRDPVLLAAVNLLEHRLAGDG